MVWLPGKLLLPHAPEPANAASLAAVAVDQLARDEGIRLDYSPASLQQVDVLVCRLRAQQAPREELAPTLFLLGCYAGEVMVRQAGFVWKRPDECLPAEQLRSFSTLFLVVLSPWGVIANPIVKVFKLFHNGMQDSIAYFYQCFSVPSPGGELLPADPEA